MSGISGFQGKANYSGAAAMVGRWLQSNSIRADLTLQLQLELGRLYLCELLLLLTSL